MGNYKFRFSDMMPNAWFYKLRDMSNKKPRSQKVSSTHSHSLTQSLDQKIKTSKRNKTNTTFPNSSSSSTSSPSTATTTTTTTVSFKPNLPYSHSPRKSYYFTRDCPTSPTKTQIQTQNFPDSPRRSSSRNRMRKRRSSLVKQSQKQLSSARTSCSTGLEQEFSPGSSSEKEFCEERCDRVLATDPTTFDNDNDNNSIVGLCSCGEEREKWKDNDIVIDVDRGSYVHKHGTRKEFDAFATIELPPITTKLSAHNPKKKEKNSINSLARKTNSTTTSKTITSTNVNNYNSNSPGFRVRINNSPRIANKKVSGLRKSTSSPSPANTRKSKSLSDSLAVVKSSFDPQRDFRESMLEMIIEHNIRASKDLEDLLACYLSLNSDEYHGVIIKVFKQIWFDITDIK